MQLPAPASPAGYTLDFQSGDRGSKQDVALISLLSACGETLPCTTKIKRQTRFAQNTNRNVRQS